MQDFVHQRYREQQGRWCSGFCHFFWVGTLVKSRINWRDFSIPNMGSLKRLLPQRWLLLIEIQIAAVFFTFRGFPGLDFQATVEVTLSSNNCGRESCGFLLTKLVKEQTIPPYWAASVWGKSFLQVCGWLALLLGFGVKWLTLEFGFTTDVPKLGTAWIIMIDVWTW